MLTVAQAAKKLKLSQSRMRVLLQEGRIVGAQKFGMVWVIPGKPVIEPPLETQYRRKRQPK